MPGPKPKPTNLKLLQGNPGQRALPQNEPKPRPNRPKMPSYLGRIGRKRWKELLPELHGVGVLTIVDGDVLGGYCLAYETKIIALEHLRDEGEVVEGKTNPWRYVLNRAMDDERHLGPELGIGAASRSKIDVKRDDDQESPLASLLAQAQANRAARRGSG